MKRLLCALPLVLVCLFSLPAFAAFQNQRVEDVLHEFQRQGINILFSSDLVSSDMRVEKEPRDGSPREVLNEIVQPHGLRILKSQSGTLLVIKDYKSKQAKDETTSDERLPRTDSAYVVVPFVTMYLSAEDSQNRSVRHLNLDHFTLMEDGEEQPIAEFTTLPESTDPGEMTPLSIIVLADVSESMEQTNQPVANYDVLKETVGTLLDHSGADDHLEVFEFNDTCRKIAGETDRREDIKNDLQGIKLRGGRTSLYDSLLSVSEQIQSLPGRRIIVLYSDGADTASHASFVEALAQLKAAETTLFAIATQPKQSANNYEVLQKMAEETGGALFIPDASPPYSAIANRILDSIRAQYVIGYVPPNPNIHKWRKVEIRCKAPGIHLHYRRSYLY